MGEERAVAVIGSREARVSLLTEQGRRYLENAVAERTREAYRNDWLQFLAWCELAGLASMPAAPETVARYIDALAGGEVGTVKGRMAGRPHKPSSINRKLASISVAHQAAGYDSPTRTALIRRTMQGIRRTLGVKPDRKSPLRAADLRKIVRQLDQEDLQGVRDRALLLVGYAGAFRRSELVGLDRKDVEITPFGMEITVRKSKTDQEGKGIVKKIGTAPRGATCPVRALEEWLRLSKIEEGPIFRAINRHGQIQPGALSPQSVALIVKRIAKDAGLPVESMAGHSLRAGFVTDAKDAGAADQHIMKITGHKTARMISDYYRGGDREIYNLTSLVGL